MVNLVSQVPKAQRNFLFPTYHKESNTKMYIQRADEIFAFAVVREPVPDSSSCHLPPLGKIVCECLQIN